MISILGCEKDVNDTKLTIKQLQEFYPGDISKVDHIEIRRGSTGELKTLTDKEQVQDWLSRVRNIELKPDPNQEDRVGYLFNVDLFEGNDKKLRFTPSNIEGNYYAYNEELERKIREIFERKPVKAIYIIPKSGAQLSEDELRNYPEIAVVYTFKDLKDKTVEKMAIWIDKGAIDLVEQEWFHQDPQRDYPLVIVGYSNALYSFREKMSGFGIEGPYVDWNKQKLDGGFSTWMLKEATYTSTSAFMKGYDMPLSVDGILAKSNMLLEYKFTE